MKKGRFKSYILYCYIYMVVQKGKMSSNNHSAEVVKVENLSLCPTT